MTADWLATQAAAWIAGTVFDHLSARARSRLLGSSTDLAVRGAYEAAIRSSLAGLPDAAADYTDALELFFRNQAVSAELAVMLEPDSLATPDAGHLRTVLAASGLDLATMPGFSLDAAVRRMAAAFVSAATRDDTLRSMLQYRLTVETRLMVEDIHRRTVSLSLDELRAALEIEGYRLLAIETDEGGDTLVQFHRPGHRTIVIVGSVRFSGSLLELILSRLDREGVL